MVLFVATGSAGAPQDDAIWRSFARASRWFVSAVLGAIVALGVADVAGYLGHRPASLPAQLNAVLVDAARQGLEPVYMRELDLQGTGEMTRLVVLRPRINSRYVDRSDELRVYRTTNQELRVAYVIRPYPLKDQPPYHLTLLGVGSFDRTDREEAIFTLDPEYADQALPRPFALLWNVARQNYEVRSLLREGPHLVPLHGFWATSTVRLDHPISVPLGGGLVLHGAGGAPYVALGRSRLAAAYSVSKTCNGCTGVWEFKTFCLNFDNHPYSEGEASEYSLTGRRRHHTALIKEPLTGIPAHLNAALHRGYCE